VPKNAQGVGSEYPLFRLANRLYRRWPGLYVRLYTLYKLASDRAERRAIRAAVRPGMRCLDVGANVGFTTELLGRLTGPTGKVVAFEPSPDNFAILRRRSWPAHVELRQAAAGAENGTATLYVSDDLNVDHRTYPAEEHRREIRVPLVRLDDALPGEAIDFVKLDVQGDELQVLRGMQRILRAQSTLAMLVEFWPWGLRRAGSSPEELLELFRAAGLSVSLLSGAPVDRWVERPTWYRNLMVRRG
jgi:FkbM family methyltransferase